ncbi:MAG: sugar kinase [Candidatus Afipia apatlaquensis]|uniref:2-dehydro-3-deoxygluconokinase n=1 Tax=Candidatus Afipia apatlaquensis TaxID=2712852 RepID=A0A7C9VE85_9BRAD|nr:sugar kinase [Candidatus Afipia apatlaquensis]
MTTVACIGECMIELSQGGGGELTRNYGGDTLNTAVYLARLGVSVDYVTALGTDPFSEEMVEAWKGEDVGTARVARIDGKLPGLYAIRTSEAGERSFYYWRENAAARMLLDLPQTDAILAALASYDLIYLSGVTLSLYSTEGRQRLIDALRKAREGATRVAFDTNFRVQGWPVLDTARQVYREMFAVADIVLASVDDLTPLFGARMHSELIDRMAAREVVLKLAAPGSVVRHNGVEDTVKAEPVSTVVDTTAAGDSFSAAYLAARLNGVTPVEAARAGHRLAGVVVGHRGAIIPRADMPPDAKPGMAGMERSS